MGNSGCYLWSGVVDTVECWVKSKLEPWQRSRLIRALREMVLGGKYLDEINFGGEDRGRRGE